MKEANKILLLGDPRLYEVSKEVLKGELGAVESIAKDLHESLMAFREQYGRGRAIAAPQIGIMKRVIYMNIDKPVVLINPEFTYKSPEMIELWDDCFSFPDLLVKVKRHKECRLKFKDLEWHDCQWDLKGDFSELLQHEYDHLDGILAIDKAIDKRSIVMYSQKRFIDFAR
jgi:peptide deformylase